MNLEEIQANFKLPEELITFCRANGLLSIEKIRRHVEAFGTFMVLPGCSDLIEDRLLGLLTVIPANPASTAPESAHGPHGDGSDPSLEELSEQYGLSVRALNVCEAADLLYLSDLRDFAARHGGFRKLRNCGKKTALELNELLVRSQQSPIPDWVVSGPIVQSLAGIISSHVLQLSVPARVALEKHAKSIKPGAVFNYLVDHGRGIPKFPSVKRVVKKELVQLRRKILNALEHLDAPSGPEQAKQWWCMRNQVDQELATLLFNADGKPSMLRFLDRYLRQVVNARDMSVYGPLITRMETPGSLGSIGRIAGLTRERVRQLLRLCDRWALGKIALVEDLPGAAERYPELHTDEDWLLVPPDVAVKYNQLESTDWSPRFFGYLAQVLNGHRIKLVKWEYLFDRKPDSRRLDHVHPLLLADELVEPLHKATQQALAVFKQKHGREEEIRLHALSPREGHVPDERVIGLLREVLPIRFPDSCISQDAWIIPPNARLKQEGILEDILGTLNEPSHASRIAETWNARYPEHAITMEQIRAVAVRNKEKFFSIERTSTYGLRRWEAQRQVKGGTIRDIVEDLLIRIKGPVHFQEALKDVLKYRPSTNLNSMRQNLKLDVSGRFQFLKNGYIGLAGRVYDDLPAQPSISGSLFQARVLAKFIGEPRAALVAFIRSKTNATDEQVEYKVNSVIESGRLHVSPSGIVTSVRGVKPGEGFGELPFDW